MSLEAMQCEGCTSPTQPRSQWPPPGPERVWEPSSPPSSHPVLSTVEKVYVSDRQIYAPVTSSSLPYSKVDQMDSSTYPKKEDRSPNPALRTAAVIPWPLNPTRGEQRIRGATSLTNWLSSLGVRRWGSSKCPTDTLRTTATVINTTITIITTHTTRYSPVGAPTSSTTQTAVCIHTGQTRTHTGLRTAPAIWLLRTSNTSPIQARAWAAPQSSHRWRSRTSWTGRLRPGWTSTWTKWRGGRLLATWKRSWWRTWPPTSWLSPSRKAALRKASSKTKDDHLVGFHHATLCFLWLCTRLWHL